MSGGETGKGGEDIAATEPETKKARVEETQEEQSDEKMTEEEMLIKDEHSIWQKNSPFLYDFIVVCCATSILYDQVFV